MTRTIHPPSPFAGLRIRGLACILATGILVVATSCTTAPQAAVALRPAVLVIENLGHCAWLLTATCAGAPTQSVTVPVAETVHMELSGGTYEITQEALAGLEANEAVRRFELTLTAGETYRWRLATFATLPRELSP